MNVATTAFAIDIKGNLPFEFEPVEQWAVVFDGGRPRLMSARVAKSLKSILVTGSVDSLPASAYVAVVASYADGSVRSTPVSKLGGTTSSGNFSEGNASEKESHLTQKNIEIEKLERELAEANDLVKRSSGLIEVDAVYDKIAVIDREIAEEQRAQRALKDLR